MMENSPALERVRDQIGCCGIWCGGCAVGNGAIAEASARLRRLWTDYDVRDFASPSIGWESLLASLQSLEASVTCPGCRNGGGREDCEMRSCAKRKGEEHCSACSSFGGDCEHQAPLEHMRTGAAKVGIPVLAPSADPAAARTQWLRELPARWPGSILFAEDR